MGSYRRLHVPIVLGSLRDRWCVVLKPPGFAGGAAPPAPSLESTLKGFLPPGRSISFPIKPEKDAEGLAVVTTDDAMRKGLDETLRRGLVRCCYRLLADVAAAGPLLGSAELLESGQLLSKGEEPECFNFNLYSGAKNCPSNPEMLTEPC
eukprot:g32827.t1